MKLSTVNKVIKESGFELVKAKDYFYFRTLSSEITELRDSSVMITRLGNDLNFWVDELKNKIEEMR